MILGRIEFENISLGCCGLFRTDQIYPVGLIPNFKEFKEEAIDIMINYGNKNVDRNDTFSIEQFEGVEEEQNFRLGGKSIYSFKRDCDGIWSYFENNEMIFMVKTIEELKIKWTD